MKSRFIKTVCLIISAAMLLCMCSCSKQAENGSTVQSEAPTAESEQPAFTDVPGKTVKAETVYVNIASDGAVNTITVSDWLHTDKGGVVVNDMSDLNDIVNVKGTEKPQIDGNSVRWNMASTDLYYRGYSGKELPISFEISYTLNGKQAAVEELSGVSGAVEISFNVTNSSSKTVQIGENDVDIFEPMIVIGGMVLDETSFSGVEVKNGKIIGDGSKEIALFISLPGMAQSLNLTEKELETIRNDVLSGLDFSGNFSVKADVTDFSLGNIYFAALPLSSVEGSMQLDETLSDVEGLMKTLSEIVNTVYSMDAESILETLMTNSDKITSFADVLSDAKELYRKNEALLNAVSKYATPPNRAKIKKLLADLQSVDVSKYASLFANENVQKAISDAQNLDLSKYKQLLSNPLFKTFFSDLSALGEDLEALSPLIETVSADSENFSRIIADFETVLPVIDALYSDISSPEAQKAMSQLPETLKEAERLLTLLTDNSEMIDELSSVFTSDNTDRLLAAVEQADSDEVKKLLESVQGLTGNSAETLERLKAMNDFVSDGRIYTMASDDMETSVMYVFRTNSVS